ncbi:MAG TPA: adenylate/guanylate cyclase domain-containing protein [Candidatus Acidoferrum sp.]|nr:adenylate/guanylate cyclase domain-containing protein [Candidatus Acidoferrum sp.]
MPAPSEKNRLARAALRFIELLESWWQHRVSFLISLVITLAALTLYYFTFFGEHPTPILDFLKRFEYDSLDTRYRYRPPTATPIDPAIVIVDIDQHSQEVLGRWPFPRSNFAKLLDVLHADGAAVAAFDITFSKSEVSAAPIQAFEKGLQARKKRLERVDPQFAKELEALAAESNADQQFAASIKRFGRVVLGNYFLYTEADLRDIDNSVLEAYAQQLSFFAFPQSEVIKSRAAFGKQDRASLIAKFRANGLVPKGSEANLDIFTNALYGSPGAGVGFFNVPPDIDDVVRTTTMVLPYGFPPDTGDMDFYGSLDVMAVRAYLGVRDDLLLTYGQNGVKDVQFGNRLTVVSNDVGQALINYHGPAYTYPHYSMADVVQGKLPAEKFHGKIVLVGATATGIGDVRSTPYSDTAYPGVEIHANVIDNLLHGNFLKRGAKQQLLDAIMILCLGLPLGIFLALAPPRFMWLGLGVLAPLLWIDYRAFLFGWWLNFSIPAMTITSNVLLVSLYRALVEEKEKRKVRSAFGQYLSPEVIRRLLLNPQLVEPRKTEISVMFSDIRGFTTISEQLDAQELALFLNEYLSDMTGIVFKYAGTLDKYIGDAVMAFWGAPFEVEAHAVKACESALEMMTRVREMQQKWEAQGRPHLDIGIGINTGNASVGNMGSVLRYGYTALGDTVNLSSRLEGLNKDYGTHIIINETTYAAIAHANYLIRELDLIRVKGKKLPVTIYELIGRQGEVSDYGSPEDTQKRLEQFRQARELYTQRQWEQAQRSFETILATWDTDGPSRTYWKRCQEYLFDEPPSGWDGVFTMTHK